MVEYWENDRVNPRRPSFAGVPLASKIDHLLQKHLPKLFAEIQLAPGRGKRPNGRCQECEQGRSQFWAYILLYSVRLAPPGSLGDTHKSARKEENPVTGATVLLVLDPRLRTRAGLFQDRTTDQSGRFRMETVRAGNV